MESNISPEGMGWFLRSGLKSQVFYQLYKPVRVYSLLSLAVFIGQRWAIKPVSLAGMLVSSGCCKEVSQTGWLKITETFTFLILEAQVQNQDISRSKFLLKALGKTHSLPLPAAGGPRHTLVYGSITPVSASSLHGLLLSVSLVL